VGPYAEKKEKGIPGSESSMNKNRCGVGKCVILVKQKCGVHTTEENATGGLGCQKFLTVKNS
jgi:hypothetical protein